MLDGSLPVDYDVIDKGNKEYIEATRKLVNYANDVLFNETFNKIIESYIDYTSIHFRLQKIFMESIEYPETNLHIKEHESLCESLFDLISQKKLSHDCRWLEITEIICTHVFNHITVFDQELARYSQERRQKSLYQTSESYSTRYDMARTRRIFGLGHSCRQEKGRIAFPHGHRQQNLGRRLPSLHPREI